MSKLDELLNKYCSDGTEYRKIDDFIDYIQPGPYIVDSTKYDDAYATPVLTAGQSFILGYTDEQTGIYKASKENPVIIFDDFTGGFHWVDFNFKVKSSALKILIPKNKLLNFRFFYHLMGKINFKSSEHTRLWIGTYSQIEIPYPNLEVQCEIVRILDNFAELTAELTAELSLRKSQEEFYENQLLEFGGNIERKTIGSVIRSLNTGLNPRKFFKLNTSDAKNYYVTIKEFRNGILSFTDKTDRINDEAKRLCNNRSNLEKGDVLFSGTGTIGETYLLIDEPTNWNIKEGVYTLKPNPDFIVPRFLQYILNEKHVKDSIYAKCAGGTVKSIKMSDLKSILIPVPSIDEQMKIVDILDKFNTYCHDIFNGLPAEIEGRKKQYEYYRDKLLTFKRLED